MGIISFVNTGTLSKSAVTKIPIRSQQLQRDPYAPNYELIHYGGQGAQPNVLTEAITDFIDSIEYESNGDQFDGLTINFANQIDSRGGGNVLSLIDNELFAEGSILQLKTGYGSELQSIGAAVITKKTPVFPESGAPSFTLEAMDPLVGMAKNKPRTGVSYKGLRDSQIASTIGERNGFLIRTNLPSTYENIQKTEGVFDRTQNKGVSDYEFLKKVADINGFDLFATFDSKKRIWLLNFGPPKTDKQKEVFTFIYNEGELAYQNTLLSFNPTLDAYDQGTDFEINILKDKEKRGTRADVITDLNVSNTKKLKEASERRFTGGNPKRQGQKTDQDGISVSFKAYGRNFNFPAHRRFKNEAEAKTYITRFIEDQKKNFISGNGTLVGNEMLQARQSHNLQGIANQFSGKYYFTKVVHRISRDGGYSCDFAGYKAIDPVVVKTPPATATSETEEILQRIKGLL